MPRTASRLLLGLQLCAALLLGFGLLRALASGIGAPDEWYVTITPLDPNPGELVTITFAPSYAATPFSSQVVHIVQDENDPVVAVEQVTGTEGVDSHGTIVHLRALRPGSATVYVSGEFEKITCPTPPPSPAPPPGPEDCYSDGHESATTPEVEIIVGGPKICGDTSGDRIVNNIDAYLILQSAAGLIGPPRNPSRADVDGNGMPNPRDALIILQYVANLVSVEAFHCPEATIQ